jgi:hypothetical protein
MFTNLLYAEEEEFICGINTWGTRTGPITEIKELGVKWHAPFLNWNHLEPEIFKVNLTVDDVNNNPRMIDEYVNTHDWTRFDNVIDTLLEDFNVFPVIGQCFTQTVPIYQGKPIIPHNPAEPIEWHDNPYGLELSPIGRENFFGHLYLHIRAVLRRYQGKISYWMVDPELNQSALFRIFGGWKAGNGWADWDFVTNVLITLRDGVKAENPSAVVCLPFNLDMPPPVTFTYADSKFLSGGAEVLDWPDAIADWLPYIDIVGINLFESQGNPEPNCYQRLKGRMATAIERAQGKPVIVTSIGVPSGPNQLDWTEENQASYIAQAFDAAWDSGTKGFFYFEIKTSEQHSVVISPFDVEVMDYARQVFNDAWNQTLREFKISLTKWLLWLIEQFEENVSLTEYPENSLIKRIEIIRLFMIDFRIELSPPAILETIIYLQEHFFPVLESAEGYWGLVRSDGSYKPGFNVLADRYASK